MSARLGHATVAFTLDVYTKAVPQLDREATDHVANLIFGALVPAEAHPIASVECDRSRRARIISRTSIAGRPLST